MRERFCESGLSSFADHNVLELILFYSVPRKDTNELAHGLLNHFGSLTAVFEASVERLMEVPGITYNSAVLIKLFTEVGKRYAVSKHDKGFIFKDSKQVAKYVSSLFIGESTELFYVICLNGRNQIISSDKHSNGSVNSTSVSIPVVLDTVARHKASGVILAHNHPSTVATPSNDDIETTQKLDKLLKEMRITLIDHIIVGCDGKCVSLNDLGRIREYCGVY